MTRLAARRPKTPGLEVQPKRSRSLRAVSESPRRHPVECEDCAEPGRF